MKDMEIKNIQKQPKVFYFATIAALSERFGYFFLTYLLTLIAKKVFLLSDARAFEVFALFTALTLLTPAICGYVSDNYIGIKRCMFLGLFLELLGFLLLAVPTVQAIVFDIGLAFIILGSGFFKTTPSNLIGRAYSRNDPRIDSGFTLFYMGINIGSFIASLIAGVAQKALGWHIPFLFAAAGILFGIIWFFVYKRHGADCETKAGTEPLGIKRWFFIILLTVFGIAVCTYFMSYIYIGNIFFYSTGVIVIFYFIYEIIVSPQKEKLAIFVCLVLMIMAAVFFILWFQTFSSMELFVDRIVNRNLPFTVFGFKTIPTACFFTLNPLWIFILSPFFAVTYKRLERRGRDISITKKFPLGILLIALAFFLLLLSTFFYHSNGQVSAMWVVLAFCLLSAGELLTSALGVAMVTRIAPTRLYGIMMGTWYLLALSLACEISGLVAQFASIPKTAQRNIHLMLGIYGHAFFYMGLIATAAAITGFAISSWLKKLIE